MMLSPRRFWCVLCLCAVVAGGMLFEPVQKFAKRAAIKYAFGTKLSAANFKLHRHQELLEVNELKATQFDDVVQVDATADLALVKLDMPALLDKKFVSSRVKLQGVRIELTSFQVQKPSVTTSNPWQKSLEDVIAAFQWEKLRTDCEALLKSDRLLHEFDTRMRSWLLRSQQILFHGDQLTRTIQAYSNPLRHQNEIRNQLEQLERLQLEQDGLQKQFNGVSTILASKIKEIQSLGDQDISTIRAKCDVKASSLRNQAAEQLVSEWAKQLISRQMRLSQSVTTLLQSNARTSPYNVDVRTQVAGNPLISLSGILADGYVCDSNQRFPFSASGEYSSVHKDDYRVGRKTEWMICFDADQITTRLQIASAEAASEWRIKSTSGEDTANATQESDSLVSAMKSEPINSELMFELDTSLNERQLSGKARMNLGMYQAFRKLPCAGNADLAATASSGIADDPDTALNEEWIEFNLSGSTFEPQIALASLLPAEFTRTITKSIQTRVETQCIDSESKLKVALTSKLEELSEQLELVAKNGQQTVSKQREALTAMHRELEQSLQSRDSFEYARLPANQNTSR